MSDLEQLLEETQLQEPRFPRLRLVIGGCGLLAIAALALRSHGASHGIETFVSLDEDMVCFEPGMYYAEPTKLEGTARTVEMSAEACQQRCQVVEDCAHFTFWPDGGCLLTPEISYPKATPVKFSATVSGPKFCGAADAADVADAADESSATWGAGETPTVKPLAGINGTTCSRYPACVAAGISEGNCCPNDESVSLGCCNGFPPAVVEVKIAVGSECSKFPACAALNISGGCCPTPEGVQLGCCATI